jgi:predicted metal-dependent peptidase
MNQREIFEETMINSLVDNQYVFYAHIIASTKVNFDEKFPAPAGVSFQKNQFNLHINPTTFNKYSLQERKGILVHEAFHIILRHVGRFKNKNRKIANIAADIAINQFIKDLPPDCLSHTMFNLEEKLSFENYYSLLRSKAEKIKFSDNGDGTYSFEYKGKKYTIDPHAGEDLTDSEVPQEIVDAIGEEIVKRSLEKSRGLIPSDIAEMIEKMMSKKVNWKKYIKNEMSNTTIDVEETIKRRNRRFLNRIEIKGFKQTFSSEGLVILDTSGSVESSFISKTIGEINNLSKSTGSTITMIQVDAEVQEIKKFQESHKKIGIKGRGGTYLYPAIKAAKEKKIRYDWIVVITDGEIESSWPEIPKCKVFFLMPTKAKLNLDISNMKAKVFNIEYEK